MLSRPSSSASSSPSGSSGVAGQRHIRWILRQGYGDPYYDDLDPGSFTGGITFTADGYTALAALCRRDGLWVAADIHTHPDGDLHLGT